MKQMRGVNLGGWLVLERWITPHVFAGSDASDEYSLCVATPVTAERLISQHRKEFITKQTIKEIADRGLTTVRVPVGYWLFDTDGPYVAGGDTHLDELFEWCEELSIGVILDVHAAPGSQNGWDHSGRAGDIGWGQGDTVKETLRFVEALLGRYGDKTALEALEVLNEPHWDVSMDLLVSYYRQAYDLIRSRDTELPIIMSDAFRPKDMAKKLQKQRFQGVILDVHLYQLFTESDRRLDLAGHIDKTNHEWARLLRDLTKRMPVIVGEWSAAMHELYQPIDQPEHVKKYSKDDYHTYFDAQRLAFDAAGVGWTYWTAKTAGGGPWSLLDNPDFTSN
jgi:glucan 1,3-beta-glucosidase